MRILDEKIALTKHVNLLLWRGWLFPRLLTAERRYQVALAALDESIQRTRSANSQDELVHLLALQALVLDALGERLPARAALSEGLALDAPENHIWRWLDAGPGLVSLLREMRFDEEVTKDFIAYLDSLQMLAEWYMGKRRKANRKICLTHLRRASRISCTWSARFIPTRRLPVN